MMNNPKPSKRKTYENIGELLDLFPELDFWEEETVQGENSKRPYKYIVVSTTHKESYDNASKWLEENYPLVEHACYRCLPRYYIAIRCW